jgi:hypothetical protein
VAPRFHSWVSQSRDRAAPLIHQWLELGHSASALDPAAIALAVAVTEALIAELLPMLELHLTEDELRLLRHVSE